VRDMLVSFSCPHRRNTMSTLFLFYYALVALYVLTPSVSANCGTFKGASGATYDLSSLTKSNSAPWDGQEQGTTYRFYWNFCQNLDTVPPQLALTGPVPIIQVDSSNSQGQAVGLMDGYKLEETTTGVRLTYTAARPQDLCRDSSGSQTIPRITTINVDCDAKDATGSIVSVTEPTSDGQKCKYLIAMRHKSACKGSGGSSGGLSGGSIFLIIILCVSVTYFVGGIIFNKVKNNAAGVDMLPNHEFWLGLPGLVADGFRFVIGKFRGASYSSL